jgi:hypothetical protein
LCFYYVTLSFRFNFYRTGNHCIKVCHSIPSIILRVELFWKLEIIQIFILVLKGFWLPEDFGCYFKLEYWFTYCWSLSGVGANTLAVRTAYQCGIRYIEYPAELQRFGISAGPFSRYYNSFFGIYLTLHLLSLTLSALAVAI